MTTVLLPLALLTLCALAVGYLFDRRFEAALPVVVLSVMLVLYGFYAFNLLRIGRILAIAASAALPVVAVLRGLRRRTLAAYLKDAALSPQMAVYLALLVLFYFLSQHKLVGIWDTLRLWGSLPKALHAYGTLQFGADASLFSFSQSYPPAMPLLQYFFASFSAVFSESSLFFTRAFFGLALLLPLTRGMGWKHWPGLIAVTFLILFVPYYLTTNDPDFAYYYESLYVDAPAGILCGYLCWQAMDQSYRDWFSTIAFVIAIAALTLMKDFGVLFGGLCVLGSLRCLLRAARGKQAKPALLKAAAAGGALLVAYLSWQLLMRVYDVVNYNTVTATLPTLPALTTSLSYFFSSVITVNLSVASVSLTFGAVALLLVLLYALLVYRSKDDLKEDLPFIALRAIGYGGYFFAYVMMFRDDIAGGIFPSVARYMVAMALCEAYVFLITLTRADRRRACGLHRPFHAMTAFQKAVAVLVSAALVLLSVFTIGDFWKYDGGVYEDAATAAALVEDNLDPQEDGVADVWLLIGGDPWESSLLHHRVYFDLVGSGARIKTYILQTNITSGGQYYTPQTFLAALAADGIDYVLVLYGDDTLFEEFGSLFPELIPYETDFLLYRVQPAADGGVTLAFVGAAQP